MSVLEIIGFITTLLAIWLATREHVLTWPLQLIASLLYVYLFVDAHLFGESVLQFIYAALAIYGWWCWRKPKRARWWYRYCRLADSPANNGCFITAWALLAH